MRAPALILAVGVSLACLGALATVLAIWSSRDVALRRWEERLVSTTHILTAHATQTIGAADLMLRGVEDNLKKYRFENADDFRSVIATRRIFEMLREAANGLPQIAGVGIVSTDGTLLNLSSYPSLPQVEIAEREYLQAHIADAKLDVFLSAPVVNRLSHEPRFFLTRKIKTPSGEMLGILATGLRPDYFSDFYHTSALGVTRVTLLRRDGAPLADSIFAPSETWINRTPKALRKNIRNASQGIVFGGGQATRRSFDEITAFEHSKILPIAVSVSASREQVLREWEKESVKFIMIGGTMIACLVLATLLLARLVRQLEQARNAALSAVDVKSRFISSISHELRTPMNTIIGGSHQLMQTGLTQTSMQFAQIISSSARQLMVLINDLLDFSSYEARNYRIEYAQTNMRDMAREAIEMTRILVPDTGLDLICKVDPCVPDLLMADGARIKQVLLNLLGNAVKYTPKGRVELRLSYIRGTRNLLILQVIDTGPGISHADQKRIFEPFERTHAARTLPGTGLGLTISKKLVEAMGGEIRLFSNPGEGTHFTVELPALPASPHDISSLSKGEAHAKAWHPDSSRQLQILVAEDVAPSRMLLTVMLENMGHHVTQAENGLEAFQAASQQAFDLILMDLQMPVMDGVTATRRIRDTKGPNVSTSILAVSANADIADEQGFAKAGFNDRLLKPVAPERLKFLIASLAARS